jgi:hypothetical protein
MFLMHRVELKERWYNREEGGTAIVPNAPCGVENLELKEKGLNF